MKIKQKLLKKIRLIAFLIVCFGVIVVIPSTDNASASLFLCSAVIFNNFQTCNDNYLNSRPSYVQNRRSCESSLACSMVNNGQGGDWAAANCNNCRSEYESQGQTLLNNSDACFSGAFSCTEEIEFCPAARERANLCRAITEQSPDEYDLADQYEICRDRSKVDLCQ